MTYKFRKERYINQEQSKLTGKWRFKVRYNGITKSFNEDDFLSSSQAFKKAIEFRNELMINPKIPTIKKITVQECFEQIEDIYLIRGETKRKLECFYGKYIHKKDCFINDITRADIIKDLNDMASSCSNDTITRVLSIWKKIFSVAIAKEYIERDLTLQIQAPKSHKIKANKRQELTDEQSIIAIGNALSSRLKSNVERKQAPLMLLLLFYTGMRPAEMFALHKSDINFKKKTLSIQREVDTDRNGTNIRPCKTEMSHRIIPINDKTISVLKEASKITNGDILFDNNGGYYSSKDIADRYHRIAKSIGIDFHMYQCRHTFITNLFMKGIDIKTIQMLVGQNVDATTIGYVVTNEERMRQAIIY